MDFTIDEFIRFAESAPARIREQAALGVGEAADMLLSRTREVIGTYQRGDLGGAPAWAELAGSTKRERRQGGYAENDPGRRSGAMADTYGTRHSDGSLTANVGSDDPKAVAFERGQTHTVRGHEVEQPPRPVLRIAGYRNANDAARIIERRIARALHAGE